MDPLILTTTGDNKETLQQIANQLVSQGLAACVQVGGPVESTYLWEGKIEVGSEWQCVIKTSKQRYQEVEKLILDQHNYDNPQLIGVEVVRIAPKYKQWLTENIGVDE